MIKFTVKTKEKDEVVDITEKIEKAVEESGAESGLVNVFSAHTTCSITTTNLDPGTDKDLLDALRKIAPNLNYRHPHNPKHANDHILTALIGPSISVPFTERKLEMGTWQRIVLVELDGPRDRQVKITILSE